MIAALRRFLGAMMAAALLVGPAQAEEWLDRTAEAVRDLQLQAACFGGARPESIHILGVTTDARPLVEEPNQIEILSKISGLLSSRTVMRVTKADTFQYVATASQSISPTRSDEISRLLARSDRADITLMIRPFRVSGETVDAEIILVARDNQGGSGVNCTPSFLVSIPIADPRCATYFGQVSGGTIADLEAFARFFPHCPQAEDAKRMVEDAKEREARAACDSAFDAALRENTVEAFDEFIAAHPDCRLRGTAERMRQGLRREADERRACSDGFAAAGIADTADAYTRFAERYPNCQEAAVASQMARLRREQEAAAEETRKQEEAARQREEQRRQDELRRQDEARRLAEEAARRRAEEEEARRKAEEEAAKAARRRTVVCYVADVRPPDAWLALRTEPSTRRGQQLRRLPSGTPIEMLGERSGTWHRVRISDGTVGWVSWQVSRWISC
ncbi:SH3 domain-containing protein [Acuticoccus mangrovi]|uniref:SH3 domain-containing protein n=1 Tax=Acuticoccus mangrovi TaxID=2796142 RepID=A0A934IJ90_9HYPH|nr:SH3 domain-containing protein [Acuticoccus mangrovi]MBJ3777709.1 SH3 domain-containing protein [Acuticoccus mangrovi]